MTEVWDIMSRQLRFIHLAYDVRIHSFVLMSNHFHLLISTPECNLNLAMWDFMKETSRALTRAGNRTNLTYGSRYFRCIVNRYHYFMHAYKYVYLNPVMAGICDVAEAYPFSTLYGLLGYSHLFIPVEEDTILMEDVVGTLAWLNRRPRLENWEAVKFAMQKSEFSLRKDSHTNKNHALEIDAL